MKVLADFGVSAESMGVPIEAYMEARRIGATLNGRVVFFSVPALDADDVVAINRLKPHTDFRVPSDRGILKMLTIDFGRRAQMRLTECSYTWGRSL